MEDNYFGGEGSSRIIENVGKRLSDFTSIFLLSVVVGVVAVYLITCRDHVPFDDDRDPVDIRYFENSPTRYDFFYLVTNR